MSTTKNNHVNLTANPGPLGLCGFALTTWLLCLINAGIFDTKSFGLVLGMAFAFGALALGDATGNHGIVNLGGYLGLVTALCAFYLAAAEVINESYGRTVLPIGEPK